jgi:protein-S-isoprenylcysteine O-methyltransferase Ste14
MRDQAIILALWLVSWTLLFLVPVGRRTPEATRATEGTTKRSTPFKALAVAAIVSIFIFYTLLWTSVSEAGSLYGLILVVAGQALMIWSRMSLFHLSNRGLLSELSVERTRRGPYARMRHPMYTGLVTALAGSAIVTPDMRAQIFLIAVIMPIIIVRARMER